MVDLPNMETHNNLIENNPILHEQIKQIVQGLNVSSNVTYKLPPEIAQYQAKIEEIIDRLGDVKNIIEQGLTHDLTVLNFIVSLNYDDDNDVIYIEKIPIPAECHVTSERNISFFGNYIHWDVSDYE